MTLSRISLSIEVAALPVIPFNPSLNLWFFPYPVPVSKKETRSSTFLWLYLSKKAIAGVACTLQVSCCPGVYGKYSTPPLT